MPRPLLLLIRALLILCTLFHAIAQGPPAPDLHAFPAHSPQQGVPPAPDHAAPEHAHISTDRVLQDRTALDSQHIATSPRDSTITVTNALDAPPLANGHQDSPHADDTPAVQPAGSVPAAAVHLAATSADSVTSNGAPVNTTASETHPSHSRASANTAVINGSASLSSSDHVLPGGGLPQYIFQGDATATGPSSLGSPPWPSVSPGGPSTAADPLPHNVSVDHVAADHVPSHSTLPSGGTARYGASTLGGAWPAESRLRCDGEGLVERTCHFKNLVYDRHDRLFKFLAPKAVLDGMPELRNLTQRDRMHTIQFLKLGVMSYLDVRDFHIAFVDEPFPPAHETCDDAEPTYLHTVFNGDSFGHLLRDNINIIAGNLLRLGLSRTNHKLVVMNHDVPSVLRRYGSYISTRVSSMAETSARCSRPFILFRDLVAGHGFRTLLHVRQQENRTGLCAPPPFLAQREIALRLAGLPVVSVSQIPFTRVLILDREPSDKRRIDNIPDLLPPLRQRFPHAQIVSHTLLHLSARDQLRYLSQTSVLVTTIGSASFRLLYLPTDAHVILIGAPEHIRPSWADRAVHEATECWNFIGFVKIDVYHVTEKAETVQRFVKRKFDGKEPDPRAVARDADVHVNVTKLGDLMESAIADIKLHREPYRLRGESWRVR